MYIHNIIHVALPIKTRARLLQRTIIIIQKNKTGIYSTRSILLSSAQLLREIGQIFRSETVHLSARVSQVSAPTAEK